MLPLAIRLWLEVEPQPLTSASVPPGLPMSWTPPALLQANGQFSPSLRLSPTTHLPSSEMARQRLNLPVPSSSTPITHTWAPKACETASTQSAAAVQIER